MTTPPTIYFIQAGDDGPIKIGFTEGDVQSRFRTLQSACAWNLRILGTMTGTRETEHDLHARFAEWRMAGEWFRADPSLLDFVGRNCNAAPERPAKPRTVRSQPVAARKPQAKLPRRAHKSARRAALQIVYRKPWQEVALEWEQRIDLSYEEIAEVWAAKTGEPFSASTVCRTISTAKRIETEGAAA